MVIFFSEIGTVVKNTFHAKYGAVPHNTSWRYLGQPHILMTEKTHGLCIKPGEAVLINGEQAQEEFTQASDDGG